MSYLEVVELRDYIDAGLTTDDPLLGISIGAAQRYIDSQTNRHFEAETKTRYYQREDRNRWNSRLLDVLNDDLLTVATLTNGDSSGTTIAAANYWLTPRNEGPPYHGVLLKTDISDYWQWDTDYWVSIAGTWGYSATVPDDIRWATTVLAAYAYRSRDSQVFEVTAILESGALAIPQGIPATVTRILQRYKRHL
jgi:hypothetical protein